MMTTLITVMTLILVLVIGLWAVWPKLRAWIEQPKHEILEQIKAYENTHVPPEQESPDSPAAGRAAARSGRGSRSRPEGSS